MKIVIAGAGEVGFHLIENLSREDLDIFVIDINQGVLDTLKRDYDITTDHSNITDSKYLTPSHLKDADLFLAITNSDETNMIACKIASEAGVKQTICRIRQIDFSTTNKQFSLKSMGIDRIINPVSLMADELYKLILTPNIVDNQDFFDGGVKLIGFKIRDYSSIVGKSISALEDKLRQNGFHIGIIQRTDLSIIPEPNEVIKENDTVYFLCKTSQYQALRKFLGYDRIQKKIRDIFIIGGGHMGLVLAKRLEESNQEIKVIEKRLSRSFHIAEKLQKSLVLHFDGTDLKELKAEGIENADHFIAITDSEQINLSSCLIAAEQGVKRTFCLVKQPELIQIIDQNTPITLGISPRVITARYLVRFIQGADISAYFSPFNSQIEVLEILLNARAPCLNSSIETLDLPENVKIGMIKRENRYLLPTDENVLRVGDTILLLLHRLDRERAMRVFQQPST